MKNYFMGAKGSIACKNFFSIPFELTPVNAFVSIVNFIGSALINVVVALGTYL